MTRSTATSVAILDRLPVLTKDELLERQANDPPFAGLVASDFHPRRVFQWPSQLYDAEPDGKDPWRWRPALESAGFGRSDVVLNAFAYHLTPAGAMFEEGPAGSWAPQCFPGGGQHRRPGAGVCSPGRHRLRRPPVVSQGLARGGRRAAGVRRLVDTVRLRDGRTAARVPAAWLLERLDVVLEGYGTAESGDLGYECSHMPVGTSRPMRWYESRTKATRVTTAGLTRSPSRRRRGRHVSGTTGAASTHSRCHAAGRGLPSPRSR
jgi:phenylacetate-CoA ligase